MPTARLHVPDLQSSDCERRLVASLTRLAGVHGAVASRVDHCVEVDFEDDEVSAREMIDAARTAGFTASLVS
jgi:copper chaperone CopZ